MIDPYFLGTIGVRLERFFADMEVLCVGEDDVVWHAYDNQPPSSIAVKRVPKGTTSIYNYSDKLIGYTTLSSKSGYPIRMAIMQPVSRVDLTKPLDPFAHIKEVILEIGTSKGKPCLLVRDDVDLTDVRDVTLLRDPPAVQTNQQMHGEPVWYELTTQRFYFVDSYTQKRHDVTKEIEYYGQYRQAGTQIHSHTAQNASQSPGAAPARITATKNTFSGIKTSGKSSGFGINMVPGLGVGQLGTTFGGNGNYQCYVCGSTQYCSCLHNLRVANAYPYTPGNNTKPLPREDPKVGEIIAWRGWAIDLPSRTLLSVARSQVKWEPGAVVQSPPPDDFIYSDTGIHAFKDRASATTYLTSDYGSKLVALGQVALWGEVVEGERGYRAEFARVISVEEILNKAAAAEYKLEKKWFHDPKLRTILPDFNVLLTHLQGAYNNREPSMGEGSDGE